MCLFKPAANGFAIFFISIQGVLILQDQYRAMIQYSFTKDTDAQYDKIPTDWYCNCGVFNFKRRDNCFKCSASREESEKGGEGSDEISKILTKSKRTELSCSSINSFSLHFRNNVPQSRCSN